MHKQQRNAEYLITNEHRNERKLFDGTLRSRKWYLYRMNWADVNIAMNTAPLWKQNQRSHPFLVVKNFIFMHE